MSQSYDILNRNVFLKIYTDSNSLFEIRDLEIKLLSKQAFNIKKNKRNMQKQNDIQKKVN